MGASSRTMDRACEDRGLDMACFGPEACFDERSILPGEAGCPDTVDPTPNDITREMCEEVRKGNCPGSDKLSVGMCCLEDPSGCGALHYGVVVCTDPSNILFDFAICGERTGKCCGNN